MSNLFQIEEAIFKLPHLLKDINNHEIIECINYLFPYSHGIEFECFKKNNYNIEKFESIPNIMAVSSDSTEQRYRIPSGLDGLICLYEVCKLMKECSKLDLSSSNHYHTDMTLFKEISHIHTDEARKFREDNDHWIIEELKLWETAFDYSKASLNSWYKYNDLGTLEIRIGEPTFEYEIISKRLMKCASIVKRLTGLEGTKPLQLLKLRTQLELLSNKKVNKEIQENEIQQIIKNRIIKL